MYGVSKLGEIALTKLYARDAPASVVVTACCPGCVRAWHRGGRGRGGPACGAELHLSPDCTAAPCRWCATDMSSWKGPRAASTGAETPVWLALQPPGPAAEAQRGRFFQDRAEKEW